MKEKILVCEDELSILNLIKEVLEAQDFEVFTAENGKNALEVFEKNNFDLVITDVMMPIMDGFEFTQEIRRINKEVPVLMLTALDEEYNELRGFNVGVDDYVSKPFSVMVLVKRVEALLKRNGQHVIHKIGDIVLDSDAHTVLQGEEVIELTVKEFAILKYLMENKNRVVSRENILENVWGYGYYGDVRNVDTHVKNIRKKMNLDKLVTVKGLGYNFVD